MTQREPEFDHEQRELLLAHLRRKADMGPHGQPMSETTSPLADPSSWDAQWSYEGTGPYVDYAERARQARINAYKAKLPKDAEMPAGLIFGVRKVRKGSVEDALDS